MITPELVSHIKEELAKGKSKEQIRAELIVHGGWHEDDIKEGFQTLQISLNDKVSEKSETYKTVETENVDSPDDAIDTSNSSRHINLKNDSESSRIAFRHFMTAGIWAPLAMAIVIIPVIGLLLQGGELLTQIVASFIIGPLVAWTAVMISAKILITKYHIQNPKKVAKLATIYLVSISLIFIFAGFLLAFILIPPSATPSNLSTKDPTDIAKGVIDFIGQILFVIIFYTGSRRYLSK